MLQGKHDNNWQDELEIGGLDVKDEPFDFDNEIDFITAVDDGIEDVGSAHDFDTSAFEETYIGELARGGDQPVPRISIQVFCERAETAQLMQSASTDRRIAKATVTVSMGGMNAAIDFYQTQAVPNLIIVESTAPSQALLTQLDQLASLCDDGVKVILIGQANDIGLYRELLRRGVSEYLVPPLQPLQIIRAISSLYIDPSKPFLGQTIVFVGAKGGTGSSTVAHNVAWCMAEHARVNTTLVDLDLSFGTTGLDFNVDSANTVAEALEAPERIDDVLLDRLLTRFTERLTLFTAPSVLDKQFDIHQEAYEVLIDGVRRGVPFVVIDMPHVWSDWSKHTLINADEVVIVCEPDLAGLRNAKNIFDQVKSVRANDSLPKIVLNKVGMPKRPEIPVKDFGSAIGAEPILVLPFDPLLFGTAANNGQMVAEVGPQSKCLEGFDYLAASFTGRAPQKKEKTSVFDKLKSLKFGQG